MSPFATGRVRLPRCFSSNRMLQIYSLDAASAQYCLIHIENGRFSEDYIEYFCPIKKDGSNLLLLTHKRFIHVRILNGRVPDLVFQQRWKKIRGATIDEVIASFTFFSFFLGKKKREKPNVIFFIYKSYYIAIKCFNVKK